MFRRGAGRTSGSGNSGQRQHGGWTIDDRLTIHYRTFVLLTLRRIRSAAFGIQYVVAEPVAYLLRNILVRRNRSSPNSPFRSRILQTTTARRSSPFCRNSRTSNEHSIRRPPGGCVLAVQRRIAPTLWLVFLFSAALFLTFGNVTSIAFATKAMVCVIRRLASRNLPAHSGLLKKSGIFAGYHLSLTMLQQYWTQTHCMALALREARIASRRGALA